MEYPSALKKKNEDQTSFLLLIWKGRVKKNAWAMVENLNGADAPKISECGGISLDLPEERLLKSHSLQVGSHLYCIGGTNYDRIKKFEDPRASMSSKVFRFNINQPSEGWKVCHHLPFFCGNIRTAVSGALIYIFPPCYDGFYKRATDSNPFYCIKEWAYIIDTEDITRSKYISCPIPSSSIVVQVAVCASMDDVAGVHRGVMVYLKYYGSCVAWFHDPVDDSWKTHNRLFGFKPTHPVIPPSDIIPDVFASTVSNGILYIFRVRFDWALNGSVATPLLSAYDIGKGKLLFMDLSFKGPHSRSGRQFINFLFAVGDCKLCWFEYFPGEEVLSYTVISISYGAHPSLSVGKSGALDDFQFYSVPSCLAIDSLCLDQIKRLSPREESSKRLLSEYISNQDSPHTSILMLLWKKNKVENNKVENVWVMINNLDITLSPYIKYGPLALPEGSESEECLALPPLYPLLVGSHLYCIGGVEDLESKKHFLSDKVLQFDIPSAGWKVFYCLPFFCKDILTSVSGDFIFFFPRGETGLHSKSKPFSQYSDWAYILDTKERKGQYLRSPLREQNAPVTVCVSLDDGAGVCPGVIVYLLNDFVEEAWFYDPVQNSWKFYSRFIGQHYLEPFAPPGNIVTTASKGILYTLRFWKEDREPLLTIFDLVKEELICLDLGLPDSYGSVLINYLFAIGDCKLCWLAFSSDGLIYYTIILLSYDPILSIEEVNSGVLGDFDVNVLPSCLAIDSFCVDRIKRLPHQVV